MRRLKQKYMFDAKIVKDNIIKWIQNQFNRKEGECNAVVYLSGTEASAVVAALCVEALGNTRVIGVLMPDGDEDTAHAYDIVKYLNLYYMNVNIEKTINSVFDSVIKNTLISCDAEDDLPERVRMTTLYAVSQSMKGIIVGTYNLSEIIIDQWVKNGIDRGDISPLSNLTITEIKSIGYELGLPKELIENSSAFEKKYGIKYNALDTYIRTGTFKDKEMKRKIEKIYNNRRNDYDFVTFFYSPNGDVENIENVI